MTFDMSKYKRDEDVHDFTHEGEQYSIKPLTMEESAVYNYLYKIPYVDEFGQDKIKTSYELIVLLKLSKMIITPFTAEGIKDFIGIEQEWTDLSIPQRFKLLQKFEDSFIIDLYESSQKNSVEELNEEAVKNF